MDKPLTLFCIDDDPEMLFIIEASLRLDANVAVTTASGSHEALQALICMDYRPDCILLDIIMPRVDGKMLLGEIRGLPRHVDTPVIFLTTAVRDRDETSYLALGARGMIAKPFDPLTLASQVRSML